LGQELSLGSAVVDRAAAGDRVAFAQLIAAHHAQMMRVAYVITGDAQSAGDAVQSAWEIAWRRLATVRDRTQVRSWLVAVAANEARKVNQRSRRHAVVDISSLPELAGAGDPGDSVSVVDLKRALAALKPEDRALLTLKFVGHLDSNAIALQLGLSASGVRSRLDRLLDRLRADLDPREENR
jgi:RNA polymerase sigma-70 factor (ECF subfamily)